MSFLPRSVAASLALWVGIAGAVCNSSLAADQPKARPQSATTATPKPQWIKPQWIKPQWIWLDAPLKDNQMIYLRKIFAVPEGVKSALLIVGCDERVSVFINGKHALQHDHWEKPVHENITEKLQPGANVIALRCSNSTGSAGALALISLELADGTRQTIVSDLSWLAAADPNENWRLLDYDTTGWTKAKSFGELGVKPWGLVPVNPLAPVMSATAAEEITALEGFRVELLYSVPKGVEGSWISLTPDNRGRLIVSDQFGSLYRVTPATENAATQVEQLKIAIGAAHGLLYAYDSLYVTVNGDAAQGLGFYRVRDTDGDDQFDEVKLLTKLEGIGEHGPHGIRLGPDGMLYLIAGNHTHLPEKPASHSPHQNWAEDLLLPRNPDGRGQDNGILAPGGWICRTDRDGTQWEVFCGGFRNCYDLDFNPEGELFTFDADMEWDTGTPWYRPTRVNHAVSGAEFGWRFGTGKWPAYYPDSLGAMVDIGYGSPTGVQFGTGAKFPAKYQQALFVSDWTYGKMYAVHLQPKGAGYAANFETFLKGRPLPVTDVVILPDGAMYFTTGGRRMQSGLYRVTYTGTEETAPAAPVQAPAATAARQLRRQLEAFHLKPDAGAIELAWPTLNSSDRTLRYAARIAIERQELALWQAKALAEQRTTAAIHALLALTRVGGAELQQPILERLARLPLGELSEEQLLDTLRVYGLAFIRLGGKSLATAAQVIERLSPLYPADSELVNRELCGLLVYLEAPGVIERSMQRLTKAQTQEDQLFYVFTLRNLRHGWTSAERRAYFSWLNLAETKYLGGASFQKFIQQIRRDVVETLPAAEQTEFQEVIEGRTNVEVVKLETTRQFIHNWQLEDLLPVLRDVGKGRSFEKGKQAYQAAQCYKCHRFKGEGGDTGPDITGVGSRFDPNYLLESLIVPSKAISDQYINTQIQTADGKVITGRILDENAERLLIRTDPFARKPTEVKKIEIEIRQLSKESEMPQGLINILTQAEILDLIAYLRSAGDPQDRAFRN